MFNPRNYCTSYAMNAATEVERLEARLTVLNAEIPARQEEICRMVATAGLQSAEASGSATLLQYMDTVFRPAVLGQTQRVAEQAQVQVELATAKAVMERPGYLTDLAAEKAVEKAEAKAKADAEEKDAREDRLKLDAEAMLCRQAGIAVEGLSPWDMRGQLNEYVRDILKGVSINHKSMMMALPEQCESGTFVTYEPPRDPNGRTNAMPDRYRALVLQRVPDNQFVIVYIGSWNNVSFDIVSGDTLGRISNDEPVEKRARV
jgi:hypothetical protein